MLMDTHVTKANLNDRGRFADLKKSVSINKATAFFEQTEEGPLPEYKVRRMINEYLTKYILQE